MKLWILCAATLLLLTAAPAGNAAADNERNVYFCPHRSGESPIARDAPCPPGDQPDLPQAADDLPVRYRCEANRLCDLGEFIAENRVCVLMVMHQGKLRLARADNGSTKCDNTPVQDGPNAFDRPFGIASMAKSITSTLFGLLNSQLPPAQRVDLGKPVTFYLKSLSEPGFDPVTVGDVLQMASGLAWSDVKHESELRSPAIEDALDPAASTLPEAIAGILKRHKKGAPGRFNYSAVDTTLVGLLAESELANLPSPLPSPHLATALAAWIWQKAGMQDQLRWKADRTGTVAPWCCAYATPRDLLRLGQWVLDGLDGRHGQAVGDWLGDATTLHQASTQSCSGPYGKVRLGYGYQWWVFQRDKTAEADPDRGFTALGRGGQFLHIVPDSGVVILQLSDWRDQPGAWSSQRECATYALHDALIRYMRAHP